MNNNDITVKNMTKILFVCSANVDRSPTAERIYENYPALEVKSAGVGVYATTPVSAELLQWADIVLCMEKWHKTKIEIDFTIENKVIDYLDVEDNYEYMEPELIEIIKGKVDEWLIQKINQI